MLEYTRKMAPMTTCLIPALLFVLFSHQSLGDDDFYFKRQSRQVVGDDEDLVDGSGSEPIDEPITTRPSLKNAYVSIKV